MITITKGISETTIDGLNELYVCPKSVNPLPEKVHSGILIDQRFFRSGDIFITHRFKDRTEDDFSRALEARTEFEHFCNRVVNIIRVLEDIVPEISEDMILTVIGKEKQGIIRKVGDWLPAKSVLEALSLPSDNIPRLYKHHRKIYDYGLEYLMSKKRCRHSFKLMDVQLRHLLRLEYFEKIRHPKKRFSLCLEELTTGHLDTIRDFISHEYEISQQYPKQMEKANAIVDKLMPRITHPIVRNHVKDGSRHTMDMVMNLLHWLTVTRKENTNLSFRKYEIGSVVKFGDIATIESSDIKKVSEIELSEAPFYEMMRDIFLFQCQTGCRYRDLKNLTHSNLNGSYLDYEPERLMLRKFTPITHLWLNDSCMSIIKKHSGKAENDRLFYFPNQTEYERILRDIFTRAGLNHKVSIKTKGRNAISLVPLCECVTSESAEQYFHCQRMPKDLQHQLKNNDSKVKEDTARAALMSLLDS
ncbi:MAG: hypothetical protein MJZ16_13585 [Bacteroidales bacterium]|nr:hypothetical protein [Bacteroidales bacterium]